MKSRDIKVETATYITVYEAISRGLWVFVAILKNNTRQLTITYYKPVPEFNASIQNYVCLWHANWMNTIKGFMQIKSHDGAVQVAVWAM